jgi:hypothetical protein
MNIWIYSFPELDGLANIPSKMLHIQSLFGNHSVPSFRISERIGEDRFLGLSVHAISFVYIYF